MIDSQKIFLIEKYFEDELSVEENEQFEYLLQTDKEFEETFNEQKRIKDVLNKMSLKNPSKEHWDSYWLNVYNKIERKFSWILLSIGAIILLGYGFVQFINEFLTADDIPLIIKIGFTALIFGVIVLGISVFREKIFTYKKNKYRDIQR